MNLAGTIIDITTLVLAGYLVQATGSFFLPSALAAGRAGAWSGLLPPHAWSHRTPRDVPHPKEEMV